MSKNKKHPDEDLKRIDFDGKWKSIIESLFEHFILFFLPELHQYIDFTYEAKFLKQDLPKIAADQSKKGDLINDNLIEVRLKSGERQFLLIHIEVHGYEHVDFGKKMFTYFYRTADKWDKEITAFALFLNPRLPKNYDSYHYSFGKTKVTYEFPVYLVRAQEKEELLKSSNPFAIAILACLHINETRHQYENRLTLKSQLFRLILKKYNEPNYSREIIVVLVGFIMNIMILPKKLESKFVKDSMSLFKKSDNMYQATELDKEFANRLSETLFGDSIDDLLSKLEKEASLREALEGKRKEEETKRKKEEVKRKEEEAKRKEEQIKTILFLSKNLQQSAEQISTGLDYDLAYVKQVIADHSYEK